MIFWKMYKWWHLVLKLICAGKGTNNLVEADHVLKVNLVQLPEVLELDSDDKETMRGLVQKAEEKDLNVVRHDENFSLINAILTCCVVEHIRRWCNVNLLFHFMSGFEDMHWWIFSLDLFWMIDEIFGWDRLGIVDKYKACEYFWVRNSLYWYL